MAAKCSQSDDDSIEVIQLDTKDVDSIDGFGFGLAGNRTMGVYIKLIHGSSAADKDGRFRIGDQLLQIDDIELTGLTAEQVARVIRFSHAINSKVRFIVAHKLDRSTTNRCRPRSALSGKGYAGIMRAAVSEQNIKNVITTNAVVENFDPDPIPDKKVRSKPHSGKPRPIFEKLHLIGYDSLSLKGHMGRSKTDDCLNVRVHPAGPSLQPLQYDVSPNPSLVTNITMLSSGGSIDSLANLPGHPNIPEKNIPFPSIVKVGKAARSVDSDDSFQCDTPDEYEPPPFKDVPRFPTPVLSRSLENNNQSQVTSRSLRTQKGTNDELPLVSFDHSNSNNLNCVVDERASSEPNTRVHSREGHSPSGRSSGGSHQSGGSNKLSWHCPVCLDGASRASQDGGNIYIDAADILSLVQTPQSKCWPSCMPFSPSLHFLNIRAPFLYHNNSIHQETPDVHSMRSRVL